MEDKTYASSSSHFHIAITMVLWIVIPAWFTIHRWNQRNAKGPKTWPLLGASIEQFMNYNRMHDWLVEYFSVMRTVKVPMPFTSYTYIADPVNVEHVLKTNFANYPKVKHFQISKTWFSDFVITG